MESLMSILPLIIIIVVFYFFLIRPQRTKQKQHDAMVEALTRGDKIVTNGGFICEVIKQEQDFISVRLNDDNIARLKKEFVSYKIEDVIDSKQDSKKDKKDSKSNKELKQEEHKQEELNKENKEEQADKDLNKTTPNGN